MPPRDIKSLLDYLIATGSFSQLQGNLLSAWGPKNRQYLGANFLPPRLVPKTEDTIEEVYIRTVMAQDATRKSPASIVDNGEIFGRIHYRLGNSDLARQITGSDYEGIVHWLNRGVSQQAAAQLLGIFDAYIVQAMAEHDEYAIWQAIVNNHQERRGNGGWYEFENGPDITGAYVDAGGDWTDPTYDPWVNDIIPAINHLVEFGFERNGIRIVTTDHVMLTLANNPFSAKRLVGTTNVFLTEPTLGTVVPDDVSTLFRKLSVQSPQTYDLRTFTRTGQLRFYPENNMTFIGSTGRSEEVIYNHDDPAQVPIVVQDTLGFNAIGPANGKTAPGRQSAQRAFTDQKDSRIEFEGWQSTGAIIMEPTAIRNIGSIDTLAFPSLSPFTDA